ncbi:hydantoinase/oxoprolinase family protein [Tsukamurella serpentis]
MSQDTALKSLRVAVDVGGTFTDVCIFDERDKTTRVAKVPSTPHDPMEAVVSGVQAARIDLTEVALFSHGTTVATNALITRRFPVAAMVCTRGFRDVLEIRDGTKDELWDAYADVSAPYIKRRNRYEVAERIDYRGTVVTPLDEDAAREVARVLRRKNVQTIAVCFMNSYVNAAHENRMREILLEEIPGVTVSTSSEILPEIFEYERMSTTVANAVLAPLVSGYVNRLDGELRSDGYQGDLLLLHSGGGSMTPAMVDKYPVRLAASGIAAGAIAVADIADRCGYPNAIGLDMGGTSTDISLVYEGEVRTTKQWQVEYGFPICFPSIEVLTVGAGGGSLAWIDEAGSLRNGPQSAGADPGPACYGRGGAEPTNTDANLSLGRLGGSLIGGELTLDVEAARAAIRRGVGEPLGIDDDTAASDILQVANANMADAVRLLSIRRGYDPRDFVLVVCGGAGALHGAALAKELSIPTVVVPPHPGITSAQGCLLVDVRHDLSAMYQHVATEVDPVDLESEYSRLEREGLERLRHEGVPDDRMMLDRTISMRYAGQWRSLTVAVDREEGFLQRAVERFHQEHERDYSFRRDDVPVEIYQISLRAIGTTPKPSFPQTDTVDAPPPSPMTVRQVFFEDGGRLDTPVYDRDDLVAGHTVTGPAIIDQLDSTTVVPPEATAVVDGWSNLRIHILQEQS